MICLYCGKEAILIDETVDGIPLRTCEDGHRTGEIVEKIVEDDQNLNWRIAI